jgi:hypothetical protein
MSRPDRSTMHRRGILILGGALALTSLGSFALAQSSSPTPDQACAAVAVTASAGPGGSAPAGGSLPPAVEPSTSHADSSLPELSPTPADTSAPEPDTGAGNAHGDVPDNAVFLTYHDATHGYSIQYVEGWQVTPTPDGVVIRDKDSSETVRIAPMPADLAGCVTGAELPNLQAQAGFALIAQDRVKVHGHQLTHLAYHLPAPPDPVTGKRVPSTVDRYYVPGLVDIAVVSLSTPDGVDNVDAFRQMITSFSWQ